jgi:hypothetical protein
MVRRKVMRSLRMLLVAPPREPSDHVLPFQRIQREVSRAPQARAGVVEPSVHHIEALSLRYLKCPGGRALEQHPTCCARRRSFIPRATKHPPRPPLLKSRTLPAERVELVTARHAPDVTRTVCPPAPCVRRKGCQSSLDPWLISVNPASAGRGIVCDARERHAEDGVAYIGRSDRQTARAGRGPR